MRVEQKDERTYVVMLDNKEAAILNGVGMATEQEPIVIIKDTITVRLSKLIAMLLRKDSS